MSEKKLERFIRLLEEAIKFGKSRGFYGDPQLIQRLEGILSTLRSEVSI